MFLGVRQCLCVCVLGHVFVRVCVCTKGKQSLNKETMPFKVFPEDEGGRERVRERNVGKMERENETWMGVC